MFLRYGITITNHAMRQFWRCLRRFATSRSLVPQEHPLKCTIFDSKGRVTSVAAMLDRRQFLKDYGLHSRDLRHVDGVSRALVPLILVRKNNNMLLSICDLRVLIKRDEVLIFHSKDKAIAERLSMLVYDFSEKLVTRSQSIDKGGQDYEQTALEIVLMHAVAYLEVELNQLLSTVNSLFIKLETDVNHENLRMLLQSANDLKLYCRKTLAVRTALDDALDDELGLNDMYLSERRKPLVNHRGYHKNLNKFENRYDRQHMGPNSPASGNVYSNENPDSNDIEILLESYYSQADELVQKAEKAVNEVGMTEEIMNMLIDSSRNSLLLYRLELSVLSLGVALATVCADLYGMNLENFIEEESWGMPLISLITASLAVVGSVAGFSRLKMTRRVYMPQGTHIDSRPRALRESYKRWLMNSK